MSRDLVAALIWPESDDARARRSLRQAVYLLRRELGEGAVVGTQELSLNRRVVDTDVGRFMRAVQEKKFEEAAGLYGGPFLDGFHLSRAPEFGRWLDEQRMRFGRDYRLVLETLAERAESAGEVAEAVRLWRLRVVEEPLSSAAVLRLMQALAAAGDRPAAVKAAQVHAALVRAELECEPDPQVTELGRALRSAGAPDRAIRATTVQATTVRPAPADGRTADPAPTPSRPHALSVSEGESSAAAEHAAARPAGRMGWRVVAPAVAATAALMLVGSVILDGREDEGALLDSRLVEVRPLANLTGDPGHDPIARLAAERIRQRLATLGSVDVAGAVPGPGGSGDPAASGAPPRALPAMVVSGTVSRLREGVSLAISVTDPHGRPLGSLDPVHASPLDPSPALERLEERVASVLAAHRNEDMTLWASATRPPELFAAYAAFAAGLEAFRIGDGNLARERWLEASSLDSTYALPLLWIGYLDGGAGPIADSTQSLLAERRARMTPFEAALADYIEAWRVAEVERAYQATKRMSELAPGSEWVYVRGRLAHGTIRTHEAVETLLSVDPERGWLTGVTGQGYWATLASALKQTGEYDLALEATRRGRRLYPSDRSVLLLLEGAALAALGRTTELDSLRDHLVVVHTHEGREDLPLAWPVGWAQELLAHGHERAGKELLEWSARAYAAMPRELRQQLPKRLEYARILWIQRDYVAARDSLRSILRSAPGHPNVRVRLGMAAGMAGDTATALEMLASLEGRASPIEPYWRFSILASLGHTREALGVLREYRHFRFHAWHGNHLDHAYPLLEGYPPFLYAVSPIDGPGEPRPPS